MIPMDDNHLVTVCDHCLKASCWQGEWMCDKAVNAGIKEIPVDELVKLGLEHPSYWVKDFI
jgi:hypothetical protein